MINISDLLTGKIDSIFNGISNYILEKAENLTNGFVRNFNFSNEEKLTFINDVRIDLCFSIGDNNPRSTPSHNLDNGAIIAETIKKEPTTWTLNCKLTSIDHKEKYEKLLEMTYATLMFRGEIKENLAITNINRNITNAHYTDFTITLSKLNTVNVSTIPAPSFKKITSKVTKNVASKKETNKTSPFNIGDEVGDLTVVPKISETPIGPQYPQPVNVINPFGFGKDTGKSGGGAF